MKNMKQLLAMIVVFTMIFANAMPGTNVFAAGTQIVISSPICYAGDSISVEISMPENAGLTSMKLVVNYDDTALTLTEVIDAGKLGTNNHVPELQSPYTLSWENDTAKTNFTATGTMATLKFTVASNAEAKAYPITITSSELLDKDINDVQHSVTTGSITVTKQHLTGLSFTGNTFTYDGTAKTLAVSGLPAGATATYESADFDADGKAIDAGTYNIKATVKKEGFEDWTKEAVLTINPKPLSVTGLAVSNKVYDGTNAATLTGGTLSGLVARDAADQYCEEHSCYRIKCAIPTEGTFADKNAGSNKAVSIRAITLDGCSAENYTLTQPTGLKANITKAPITVKADDKDMIKGATLPELTYSVTSGRLAEGDAFSGQLTTRANGSTTGTFGITQGTLSAGNNYTLTFQKGTLTISDKAPQKVTVDNAITKTYGDAAFKLNVTDNDTGLGALSYTSSNTAVATVAADGTVTVKGAGSANITVSRAGNAAIADLSKIIPLTVNKRNIKVTTEQAEYTIKIGMSLPVFITKITEGSLLDGDALSGAVAVNADGSKLGTFPITQGTLTAGSNYNLTFVNGTLKVVDKTPQTISVASTIEKTYGDAPFALTVTPDATSELDAFTYESTNTAVATVAADGTVTILSAGEADIKVTQAGNAEYAVATATAKLVVSKKNVTITEIDLTNKTATIEGVLPADAESVSLDFDKLMLEIVEAGEDAAPASEDAPVEGGDQPNGDGTPVAPKTIAVNATNLVLKGDKAANYNNTTEKIENIEISDSLVVTVSITTENGTVTGSGVYLKGSNVTVSATANSGYTFNGWYEGETSVSTSASYSFIAETDKTLVAKCSKKSSGGTGGGGGGGAASNSTTTKNEDGSTTTTKTDSKTGTVTETTKNTDGSTTVVETKKDGTVTTKNTDAEGNKETVVAKADGTKEITVEQKNGIKLEANVSAKETTAKVTIPKAADETEVTIPVENASDGHVAILVKDDGTEVILKDSFADENGVTLTLSEDANIKIVDNAKDFADTKNHWASSNVDFVTARGLFNGTSETEFSPENKMTRGMLAVVLHNYESNPEYSYDGNFGDVKADSWYGEAIGWLSDKGITTGYADGNFGAEDNITREQLAVFLYRFAGTPKTDAQAQFADSDKISSYATDAIAWASSQGIMSGKGNNMLDPQGLATRAEVAAMMTRFIKSGR